MIVLRFPYDEGWDPTREEHTQAPRSASFLGAKEVRMHTKSSPLASRWGRGQHPPREVTGRVWPFRGLGSILLPSITGLQGVSYHI